MGFFDTFDIAGSAMRAESVRLNVTASNIANAQSVSASTGETYRARHPVFRAVHAGAHADAAAASVAPALPALGVAVAGIVESDAPADLRYEPEHPFADADGYVAYPNVNVVEEMADMISASRAFQVNVQMLQSVREMATRLLTLGQ
jgi:flagellar basal-body rod protein FlgC